MTQDRDIIEATLLSRTKVIDHVCAGRACFPGSCRIAAMRILWQNETSKAVSGGMLRGGDAVCGRGKDN